MPLTLNKKKEEFSRSYVSSVAAAAGYWVQPRDVDYDSVDITIGCPTGGGAVGFPKIDAQLKCTAGPTPTADFAFPLPVKNYRDLKPTNIAISRILIVLVVPEEINDWAICSAANLELRYSAYWVNLYGEPDTPNTSTISVTLPLANQFTCAAVEAMMDRVRNAGAP
ncbi:hypothetical protein Pla108_35170 [Botrimarina colliarenosi]|uniref:DUF4365 domain-containing protein n=1 Tax=Botrimarina colliarenosi TaxID=2528001 RepID=A0A5C6A785_9BACT|nr:DUF4365 domain-containing protein [Botrimarina colliarenosi]TWT95369.1 hypothetical protein Pla108_35170 [Botrimarina colliarenosi]